VSEPSKAGVAGINGNAVHDRPTRRRWTTAGLSPAQFNQGHFKGWRVSSTSGALQP
jgi:hypothetical protein